MDWTRVLVSQVVLFSEGRGPCPFSPGRLTAAIDIEELGRGFGSHDRERGCSHNKLAGLFIRGQSCPLSRVSVFVPPRNSSGPELAILRVRLQVEVIDRVLHSSDLLWLSQGTHASQDARGQNGRQHVVSLTR